MKVGVCTSVPLAPELWMVSGPSWLSRWLVTTSGSRAGILAVPAFFALSGLLITGALRARLDTLGRAGLSVFFLDRALRIIPPGTMVVAIVGFIWPLLEKDDETSTFARIAGAALTGTTNIFRTHTEFRAGPLEPLWSVAAEGQFYLVWPFVVVAVATSARGDRLLRWAMPVVIIGLVVSSASAGVHGSPESAPPVYYSVTLSFACALLGAFGALIVHGTGRLAVSERIGGILTWIGAGCTLALALAVPADWKSEPWVSLIVIPSTAASVTILALGLGAAQTLVARALAMTPVAWVGKNASYSLYLWHLPVYALLLPSVEGPFGRAVVGATAIGVALVSAVVIEQPVGRLRRRLAARRPGRAAPKPSPCRPQ